MRLHFAVDAKGLDDIISSIESAVLIRGSTADKVGAILRSDVRRQFQSAGIPRWLPLAASTVAQKRAQGYPRLNRQGIAPLSSMQMGGFGPQNILEKTMRLFESWTNPMHPEHVSKREDGKVIEGSSAPYSKFHQEGGKGGKRPPKRPIVITEDAMKQAAEAIAKDAAGG